MFLGNAPRRIREHRSHFAWLVDRMPLDAVPQGRVYLGAQRDTVRQTRDGKRSTLADRVVIDRFPKFVREDRVFSDIEFPDIDFARPRSPLHRATTRGDDERRGEQQHHPTPPHPAFTRIAYCAEIACRTSLAWEDDTTAA
ncbi:hypothetical protein [Nocardia ignorata]|uniref:hypothetical protein n=1 Tax=Nocardia ignorata TaxID=145285 RepID=UPI00105BA899|nr:hypothetical protein [Nocardia ignorata]